MNIIETKMQLFNVLNNSIKYIIIIFNFFNQFLIKICRLLPQIKKHFFPKFHIKSFKNLFKAV